MRKLIVVMFVLTLFCSGTVFANPNMILKAAGELELTDDQIRQIEELGFQHHKTMITIKADLEKLELDFRHMLGKKEINEDELMKLQDQISEKRANIAKIRLQHRLEIRKLLNDEQLDKLIKMRKRFGHRKGFDRFNCPPKGKMDGMKGFGHPEWNERDGRPHRR